MSSQSFRVPTVVGVAARAILELCESQGVESRSLRAAAGVRRRLSVCGSRLPFEKVAALWEEARCRTRDDAIGVRASGRVPFGAYGLLDMLMTSASTPGAALESLARCHALVNDAFELSLVRRGQDAHLVLETRAEGLASAPYVEFVLANVILRARRLSDGGWGPQQVHFRHRLRHESPEHARLLQARVHFGRSVYRIVFDAAALSRPQPSANPALFEEIERQARQCLLAPGRRSLPSSLEAVFQEAATSAPGTLASIARRAGMSRRALQRSLWREGTSCRWVRDGIRRRLATALLSLPEADIADVGAQLGFSEPSSFYRAFRRWTGTTPAAHVSAAKLAQSVNAPGRSRR